MTFDTTTVFSCTSIFGTAFIRSVVTHYHYAPAAAVYLINTTALTCLPFVFICATDSLFRHLLFCHAIHWRCGIQYRVTGMHFLRYGLSRPRFRTCCLAHCTVFIRCYRPVTHILIIVISITVTVLCLVMIFLQSPARLSPLFVRLSPVCRHSPHLPRGTASIFVTTKSLRYI